MKTSVKRFLVMLGIQSILGILIDFGVAKRWGLTNIDLALAWISVLAVFMISYWAAFRLIPEGAGKRS